MQFFKIRENASGESRGESVRFCLESSSGGENTQRQLALVFLAVLLLHGVLIAYLRQTSEPETPAEPLVMEVALIAAPAPAHANPAPPAPAAAKPAPRPVPVKPKKAPAMPKKTHVIRQPLRKSAPTSAPAAKAETPATPAAAAVAAPASPTAAAPAQPKAEPFTEANYRANYKSNPKPDYPRLAKSRGWQGKVLLRVQVTADGRSASVQVQQSSGHRQLDEAAVEAVENWTFLPAKRGATPVASTVTVPIQFTLNP